MFAIVMAGGSGTRLWPLSRRTSPKQLLALTGETSLLQQTVARLGNLLKPHDIYVITSQAHVRATQAQLPQLPEDNVLGEPLARSTAVAAGLATVLARRESDEVALVLPADHFVADEGAVRRGAPGSGAHRGARLPRLPGRRRDAPRPPDTATSSVGAPLHAAQPTAHGRALRREADAPPTRSRCWPTAATCGTRASSPGASTPIARRWRSSSRRWPRRSTGSPRCIGPRAGSRSVREILEPVPAISIDVGIAEPAAADGRMAVVPLDAGWSDIGSWSALLEALSARSGASLVASGQHLDRGSERVLVHGGDRLVVTVGPAGHHHRRHPRRAAGLRPRPRRGDQAGPGRDRREGRRALPLSRSARPRAVAPGRSDPPRLAGAARGQSDGALPAPGGRHLPRTSGRRSSRARRSSPSGTSRTWSPRRPPFGCGPRSG